MASPLTGLSDFSNGMSGLGEERNAVELQSFGVGWLGGFFGGRGVDGCFVFLVLF